MAYRPTGDASLTCTSPAFSTGPLRTVRLGPTDAEAVLRWSLHRAQGHSLRSRSNGYTLSWPSCQTMRISRRAGLTEMSTGSLDGIWLTLNPRAEFPIADCRLQIADTV